MLKKIYRELVLIRTDLIALRRELQSIRNAMEPAKEKKSIMVGIDWDNKDASDFTPIQSDEWEKALKKMEGTNR